MSFGRSLTKKSSRHALQAESGHSKRNSISKNKISSPVALLSTTNMITYTAPSLRNSLSTGSISSAESGTSSGAPSPTSVKSPMFPEDELPASNHLSTYFTSAALPAPVVPVRSQSTRDVKKKKSFGSLSRPRHPSMPPAPSSQIQKWPPTAQPPKELHSSRPRGYSVNPFGAELAQVAEMTEEITGMHVLDAEEEFMLSRGLRKFRANDYMDEIWQSGGVFEDELPSFGAAWI
jgi:hypothetical protein